MNAPLAISPLSQARAKPRSWLTITRQAMKKETSGALNRSFSCPTSTFEFAFDFGIIPARLVVPGLGLTIPFSKSSDDHHSSQYGCFVGGKTDGVRNCTSEPLSLTKKMTDRR